MSEDRARQFKAASESFNKTGFEFLVTDLDTGIAFADRGLKSRDPNTRKRNRENAQKAHDAVFSLMKRLDLKESEARIIRRKIELLETHLRALEEAP